MATNDLCTELSKDIKLDANMVRFSLSCSCPPALLFFKVQRYLSSVFAFLLLPTLLEIHAQPIHYLALLPASTNLPSPSSLPPSLSLSLPPSS